MIWSNKHNSVDNQLRVHAARKNYPQVNIQATHYNSLPRVWLITWVWVYSPVQSKDVWDLPDITMTGVVGKHIRAVIRAGSHRQLYAVDSSARVHAALHNPVRVSFLNYHANDRQWLIYSPPPWWSIWSSNRQNHGVAGLQLWEVLACTPVELDPLSETNYITFPSKGW